MLRLRSVMEADSNSSSFASGPVPVRSEIAESLLNPRHPATARVGPQLKLLSHTEATPSALNHLFVGPQREAHLAQGLISFGDTVARLALSSAKFTLGPSRLTAHQRRATTVPAALSRQATRDWRSCRALARA
jgi:hypothetical protein